MGSTMAALVQHINDPISNAASTAEATSQVAHDGDQKAYGVAPPFAPMWICMHMYRREGVKVAMTP